MGDHLGSEPGMLWVRVPPELLVVYKNPCFTGVLRFLVHYLPLFGPLIAAKIAEVFRQLVYSCSWFNSLPLVAVAFLKSSSVTCR